MAHKQPCEVRDYQCLLQSTFQGVAWEPGVVLTTLCADGAKCRPIKEALCGVKQDHFAPICTGQEAAELVAQLRHDPTESSLSSLLQHHHSMPLDTGQVSLLGVQSHAVGSAMATTVLLQQTQPSSYLNAQQVSSSSPTRLLLSVTQAEIFHYLPVMCFVSLCCSRAGHP